MVNRSLHLLNDLWQVLIKLDRPPFVAGNMVDLAKLIKSQPLVLPSEPKICDELKDALKKMLIPDVKRRIEWSDLFNHPITHYFAKQRRH